MTTIVDAMRAIPPEQRPAVIRWLKAARNRITDRRKWTTGMMRRFAVHQRQPVAWCALGTLDQTLKRQKLSLDWGLGRAVRELLDAEATAVTGKGGIVNVNDGYDGHPEDRGHLAVLKVYDKAITDLEATT